MPVIVGKLIREIRSLNVLGRIPPAPEHGNFALDLDASATADYVDFGDQTPFDGQSAITFEAWVYPTSNGDLTIISKADVSNNKAFWFTLAPGSSYPKLKAEFYNTLNANGGNWTTNSDAVPLNEWSHVVAAVDLSTETAYLFVGGVLKASTKAEGGTGLPSSIPNVTSKILIGTYGVLYWFDGYVGPIAVWDSVKWTSGFTPPTAYYEGDESGLIWYSPLWEGTGDKVYDIVGDIEGEIQSFDESMWVEGPGLT